MIRRVTQLASLAGLWVFAILAAAQSRGGLDVVELNPAVSTGDPARIVVTEFFSYQCPHCNSFEPVLRRWAEQLPDDVDFERVPTALGR